jgi:hypothetical protein
MKGGLVLPMGKYTARKIKLLRSLYKGNLIKLSQILESLERSWPKIFQ